MTEIKLGDISETPTGEAAEKTAEAAAEAATEGTDTADFLMDMMDRLDEKGLLEPVLFGKDAIPDADASVADDPAGDEGEIEAGGESIDAEDVAAIGKKVIDTAGDLQISQVVQLAEQNPEQVNRLIESEIGGGGQ